MNRRERFLLWRLDRLHRRWERVMARLDEKIQRLEDKLGRS